jgi:hypothetical protein
MDTNKLSLLMSSFENKLNKLVLLEKQKKEIASDFKKQMKFWEEKHHGIKYRLTDRGPIYNLVLKRVKNTKDILVYKKSLSSIKASIVMYDNIISTKKGPYSPVSLPKIDLLNFMYDNRGIDKSSSNISKISSIKSKSTSINKSKSSSSANKKKELWSKMKNIRQQNINDNSHRGGKY